MKKFFYLVLMFFAIQFAFSQETSNYPTDKVYNTAGIDVKPEFPGGYDAFYKYIAINYKTPTVSGLKGNVYVTFVIEKDGSLSSIKVLRGWIRNR